MPMATKDEPVFIARIETLTDDGGFEISFKRMTSAELLKFIYNSPETTKVVEIRPTDEFKIGVY